MTPRNIYCPGPGKFLTAGQYVQVVKGAKDSPTLTFPRTFCQWWPGTGADIVAEFRAGVHARINKHIKGHGVGRNWCLDNPRSYWRAVLRGRAMRAAGYDLTQNAANFAVRNFYK